MSIPTVQSRRKEPYVTVACVHCKAEVEYLPLATRDLPKDEPFSIKCAICNQTWIIRPPKSKQAGKRRIGTDDKPLDMTYYELLGLPVTCSTDDVKKAYRRLAIKFHPDKNPDDPQAGDRFKDIAIAYTTLSDPGLRHSYNEFGKGKGDGQTEDSMVDPEAIFSQLFGGERFQDIIGTISLGSEMKSAMQEDGEEEEESSTTDTSATTMATSGAQGKQTNVATKPELTPEQIEAAAKKKAAKELAEKKASDEKAKIRAERVKALLERLRLKLAVYTEQAEGEDDEQIASGVKTIWSIEAEELKQESYGVELLNTVGFVYSSKSRHYLASTGIIPFGLGGWFHSARSTAHIINQTVSTVRSAYALKEVFEALASAEKSGLSEEKKKELEDKAAQMGLHALFKGAKLEVESVIREVCDKFLAEEVPFEVLRKRAVALGILGSVYESVKKDENSNPPPTPIAGTTPTSGKSSTTKPSP